MFENARSWTVLGPYWAVLGRLGAVLGPSWDRPGPTWGRLGAVLGCCSVVLGLPGVVLGHLGPSLWPSWAIRALAGPLGPERLPSGPRCQHMYENPQFCACLGAPFWAFLLPPWGVFGPSCAVLGSSWVVLGPSLWPFWAVRALPGPLGPERLPSGGGSPRVPKNIQKPMVFYDSGGCK